MRVEKRERFYGRKKKMDAAIGGASRDIEQISAIYLIFSSLDSILSSSYHSGFPISSDYRKRKHGIGVKKEKSSKSTQSFRGTECFSPI